MAWSFRNIGFGIALTVVFVTNLARATTPGRESPLVRLARDAVHADDRVADAAIRALREHGPVGSDALRDLYRTQIAAHLQATRDLDDSPDPLWIRIARALDGVSAQRNSAVSGLFWHTDWQSALNAAQREQKPILSLRLLGKLSDELSCANSRFFRSTLYSNTEISRMLRERFVLHWESVRPVPVVTIDFGDGRKLRRTITGNSIHYILDCHGRLVDGLPGLYGPKAFLKAIELAQQQAGQVGKLDNFSFASAMAGYHQLAVTKSDEHWNQDLRQLKKGPESLPQPGHATDELWQQIGRLHQADAELDAASHTAIARENPTALAAGRLPVTKAVVETPLVRMLRNLHEAMAVDTVRNEYLLHRTIHVWLGEAPTVDAAALNGRVYAELFLTPDDDPWLGLAPADQYSGLTDGGLVR